MVNPIISAVVVNILWLGLVKRSKSPHWCIWWQLGIYCANVWMSATSIDMTFPRTFVAQHDIEEMTYETQLMPNYNFAIGCWLVIAFEFFILNTAPRRVDWKVMSIHHVVTLLLLFISASCNLKRFGIPVLLTHDITDVVIQTLKLSVKYKLSTRVVEILFAILVCSWMYFRFYVFGYQFMFKTFGRLLHDSRPGSVDLTYMLIGSVLLVMLLMMNMYWFVLILKLAMRPVRKLEANYSAN